MLLVVLLCFDCAPQVALHFLPGTALSVLLHQSNRPTNQNDTHATQRNATQRKHNTSTRQKNDAERGVDVAGVQRVAAPTRDVYVVRADNGDREFAGFGRPSDEYCDARLDAARLPLGAIAVRAIFVLCAFCVRFVWLW